MSGTDLTFKNMEVSLAETLQGDTVINTDHIHDNRYYTKAEVDEKLLEKENVHDGILSAGQGVKSFIFNGETNAKVELNFAEISEESSLGSADVPARLDHYHQKLYTGFGFKNNLYDGSKETIFEIDPSILNKEILSNGSGIKDFIYDGSEPKQIIIDFGDIDDNTGTSNLVARRDHIHKQISAGSGIAAFQYNGSKDAIVQVAWDNRDESEFTGISELVARADHGHKTVNKIAGEGEFLTDITLSSNGTNIELTKTFRKSYIESGLTEGSVAFSVGNAQGLVYDWIVKTTDFFICSTKNDLLDCQIEIEKIGSGTVLDTRTNIAYKFDGTQWSEINNAEIKPGRIYANYVTRKGYFKTPDKLIQLWDNKAGGEPSLEYVVTTQYDLEDCIKYIESLESGVIYDYVNNETKTWNGSQWSKIPGNNGLRSDELYVNPLIKKGYYKKASGEIISLWENFGTELEFAYVCEDEEDFEDSKKEIESGTNENNYIFYNNQVLFWNGTDWIVSTDKKLRKNYIYTNQATGKGFIFDDKVKRIWESGKVKPPVFAYICENEEDIWESQQEILLNEISDEYIYDLENNKVLQFNGLEFIEIGEVNLRNWTTYVNKVTGKGFFKYPKLIKKLWGSSDSRLPIIIRKGSLNAHEIQTLRDTNIVYEGRKFSWFKNGHITVSEFEEQFNSKSLPHFDWFQYGPYTVKMMKKAGFETITCEQQTLLHIKEGQLTVSEAPSVSEPAINNGLFTALPLTIEMLRNALDENKNIDWVKQHQITIKDLLDLGYVEIDREAQTIEHIIEGSADISNIADTILPEIDNNLFTSLPMTVERLNKALNSNKNLDWVKQHQITVQEWRDLGYATISISEQTQQHIIKGSLEIDDVENVNQPVVNNGLFTSETLTLEKLENALTENKNIDWVKQRQLNIDDLLDLGYSELSIEAQTQQHISKDLQCSLDNIENINQPVVNNGLFTSEQLNVESLEKALNTDKNIDWINQRQYSLLDLIDSGVEIIDIESQTKQHISSDNSASINNIMDTVVPEINNGLYATGTMTTDQLQTALKTDKQIDWIKQTNLTVADAKELGYPALSIEDETKEHISNSTANIKNVNEVENVSINNGLYKTGSMNLDELVAMLDENKNLDWVNQRQLTIKDLEDN